MVMGDGMRRRGRRNHSMPSHRKMTYDYHSYCMFIYGIYLIIFVHSHTINAINNSPCPLFSYVFSLSLYSGFCFTESK